MDTWDWVAIASAIAAIISAARAGQQAKEAKRQAVAAEGQATEAKRQANAAEAQVVLMVKQVEQAEKDHALAIKMHQEGKEAQRFWLDIEAYPFTDKNAIYLEARIKNNSLRDANVQGIRLAFGNGSTLESISFRTGSIKALPFTLKPGHDAVFRFVEMRQSQEPGFFGLWPHQPRYGQPHWRSISRIEVRANNQIFEYAGENDSQQPPHWKAQFQNMPTTEGVPS